MCINEILENEGLNKLLESSIGKTFNRYKLYFIIEEEDFKQEVYITLMNKLKKFDNEKSTLKTFIPLVSMTCAKNCIQNANGQSKEFSKLDFTNNIVSLEYEFQNSEDNHSEFKEIVGSNDDDIFSKLIINEILSINALTDNQKQIIKLMSKGYTVTDIARMFKKSPQCINLTYQRAKEKIVKKYAV